MRILATFLTLAGLSSSLGCSAPDRPFEASRTGPSGGSAPLRSAQVAGSGGDSANLDTAAPLTDEELDRLLDALEQEIDKK